MAQAQSSVFNNWIFRRFFLGPSFGKGDLVLLKEGQGGAPVQNKRMVVQTIRWGKGEWLYYGPIISFRDGREIVMFDYRSESAIQERIDDPPNA